MKREKTKKNENLKPIRNHCPYCCFYLDNIREYNNDGTLRFSHIPGMRFHRFSYGNLYQRIGVYVPCNCSSGKEVEKGYESEKIEHTKINDFLKPKKIEMQNFYKQKNRLVEHFYEYRDGIVLGNNGQ